MEYENNRLEKLAHYLSVDVEELKALLGLPNTTGLDKVRTIKQAKTFCGKVRGKTLLEQIALAKLSSTIKNRLQRAKTFSEVNDLELNLNILEGGDSIEVRETIFLGIKKEFEVAATDEEIDSALSPSNNITDSEAEALGADPASYVNEVKNITVFEDAKKEADDAFYFLCCGPLALIAFKKVTQIGKMLLLNATLDEAKDIFYIPNVISIELKQAAVNRMLELI